MLIPGSLVKFSLGMVLLFGAFEGHTQVTIHGTVYNMYRTYPLEAVSVMSNSGRGTMTDANGSYSLQVKQTDSLSFSYLGRSTAKFAVSDMNTLTGFDIALHVNPTELNEVRVAPRNYRADSIQNRKDYEKIFDFKKPGLSLTDPSGGSGVGFDLDELINVFRFTRTRRMLAFQSRLIYDEQDKFVDHRFNRSLVKKITSLDDESLDAFMLRYRPSFAFTKSASDYDFYDYIKLEFEQYQLEKKRRADLLKNN